MSLLRGSAIVRVVVVLFQLLACFWCQPDRCFAAAPTARSLEIYDQWADFESGFSGEPEYQFIRDYETWKQFWQQHMPKEFLPQIDLDKMMVFVWCPGPILGGERLVEALRFYKDARGLTLVVRSEIRRDAPVSDASSKAFPPFGDRSQLGATGYASRRAGTGVWRAPYLIAFLQKTSGNVSIVRPGSKARREPALMPLGYWQDMGLPSMYHPDSVSLQAPKRPVAAWKKPWELDIPNPIARPAWTKSPSQPVAVSVSQTAVGGQTSSSATGTSGSTGPSSQLSTGAASSSVSTAGTTDSSSASGDPTDIGNASGADPLQDPFNLDF